MLQSNVKDCRNKVTMKFFGPRKAFGPTCFCFFRFLASLGSSLRGGHGRIFLVVRSSMMMRSTGSLASPGGLTSSSRPITTRGLLPFHRSWRSWLLLLLRCSVRGRNKGKRGRHGSSRWVRIRMLQWWHLTGISPTTTIDTTLMMVKLPVLFFRGNTGIVHMMRWDRDPSRGRL